MSNYKKVEKYLNKNKSALVEQEFNLNQSLNYLNTRKMKEIYPLSYKLYKDDKFSLVDEFLETTEEMIIGGLLDDEGIDVYDYNFNMEKPFFLVDTNIFCIDNNELNIDDTIECLLQSFYEGAEVDEEDFLEDLKEYLNAPIEIFEQLKLFKPKKVQIILIEDYLDWKEVDLEEDYD